MKNKLLFLIAVLIGSLTSMAQNTCVGPTHLTARPHVPDYRNVTLDWTLAADTMQHTLSLSVLPL